MAEEIYHGYQQLNSSQPGPPWPPPGLGAEQPVHSHHPYDHHRYGFNGTLPHRPHVDEYPHQGPHHGMVSTFQAHGHDYPGDPSHEATSAHRVETAQEDADAAILCTRITRDPKACYACHRRKVRCNRELPCDSCVRRDHPELCSYERPTNKRRIAIMTQFPRSGSDGCETKEPSPQSGPTVIVPKEQWKRMNKELQELREQIATAANGHVDDAESDEGSKNEAANGEKAEPKGIHAPSNQMTTTHLGSRSVLAYLIDLGRNKTAQDPELSFLNESILPKLGLDNDSVTYPFVDLWSHNTSTKDINGLCSVIPDDNLCKQFFYAYRDIAGTIYPVIPEPAQFEATLDSMLANRSKALRENAWLDTTNPMGISLSFLALVFAVFASGAQCSGTTAKERELTSQVYICCSYQALRMGNYLAHPNIETVEALLIVTNVLSYNMNPGVSYIFLGLIVQMAFSMGLQINQSGLSERESWQRRRVWWAIAWQDSHFSVSYDRPTATVLCVPDIPYASGSAAGQRLYPETMYSIIRLTQDMIRERTFKPDSRMSWTAIQRYKETVWSIIRDGEPHVRERSLCGDDVPKHIERLALKLHSSYIISELCRPALEATSDDTTPTGACANSPQSSTQGHQNLQTSPSPPAHSALPRLLRCECIRGLECTIEAYIELWTYSEFAARSWITIQRAISAAFLLGTVAEASQTPRIMGLLKDLETCITALTNEDPTCEPLRRAGSDPTGAPITDRSNDAEQADDSVGARSLTKSLYALRNLNATLADKMQMYQHYKAWSGQMCT